MRRLLAAGAVLVALAAGTGMVTPAPAAARRLCVIVAGGQPGLESFQLAITRNTCGLPVRAVAYCWPTGAGTNWHYGGWKTRKPYPGHPVTSKAECHEITNFIAPWELEYRTAASTVTVLVGPVPPGTSYRAPSRACLPRASGHPGTVSFTARFGRNPCGLALRGVTRCRFNGIVKWAHGPVRSGRGGSSSRAVCPPLGVPEQSPWGYTWGRRGQFFTLIGPVNPA